MAAGALAAQPELSEGLFIGSPRFIEEMAQRFGPQLLSARTRLTPLVPGIIFLVMEARGGHRTSTAPSAGEANAISHDPASP